MNVLKRCCMRSLKENRKRTAVTIVGVILAAALITGVASLAESLRASLIYYEQRANGNFHYCFTGVSGENLKYFRNNANIKSLGLARVVGYAVLEGSDNPDKPYLYIREMDEECMEALYLQLGEGRLPQSDDELVIARHIRYNGMVDLKVGDTLTLQVGNRMSDGYLLDQGNPYSYELETLIPVLEKTYTIVGVVERPGELVEDRYAPGYSVFSCMDEENVKTGTYTGAATPAETGAYTGTATSAETGAYAGAGSPTETGAYKDTGAYPYTGTYEVYATYTTRGLKNADRVTAGILGISVEQYQKREFGIDSNIQTGEEHAPGEYESSSNASEEYKSGGQIASEVIENWQLIKWQMLRFSSGIMVTVYGMSVLAVLVVIVCSVFCIRNSFVISLTEKMKLYGRLSSVGTTSVQQRKIVYYEAAFIGFVGIPLGILSGLGASVVLVKVVSGLIEDAMNIPLVFGVSVPAVLLAVVLSGVTVFFSAMQSARRASKISPISAIRSNDSVKIAKREMKCPRLIDGLFGVGGRIAWRNLRRAKRKYRTTVVSIVISVAVFIGLTTFMQLLQYASGMHYENRPYQMYVGINGSDSYETAQRIAALEDVQAADIYRVVHLSAAYAELPLTEGFKQMFLSDDGSYSLPEYSTVLVCSLGEEGYARFCGDIGVDMAEAQDKAIALVRYETFDYVDGKTYVYEGNVAEFQSGDMITIYGDTEEGITPELSLDLEILTQTQEKPMAMYAIKYNTVVLVVSDQMMDSMGFSEMSSNRYNVRNTWVYIVTQDAGKVEQIIRGDIQPSSFTITNLAAQAKEERSMYLVIAIFLYGFITVVALIGITNIFNTITTNMELRAPEFAMLRAVGMTGGEFRRMIWLEGLFYGGKALLIGIPAGIVLSILFHLIFSEGIVMEYQPPILGIIFAIIAVAALLYGIMHYSMSKINRKNIVDTIRNENL